MCLLYYILTLRSSKKKEGAGAPSHLTLTYVRYLKNILYSESMKRIVSQLTLIESLARPALLPLASLFALSSFLISRLHGFLHSRLLIVAKFTVFVFIESLK